MTKADIVAKISERLGLEDVQLTVETFMKRLKIQLETGDNVYLRGFEVTLKLEQKKQEEIFQKYHNKDSSSQHSSI
jgi:nucleoid DNA-binding protein